MFLRTQQLKAVWHRPVQADTEGTVSLISIVKLRDARTGLLLILYSGSLGLDKRGSWASAFSLKAKPGLRSAVDKEAIAALYFPRMPDEGFHESDGPSIRDILIEIAARFA